MPKYVDVEALRYPNICIFDMKLHGATVPMVRLVDLQNLVPAAEVVPVVRCRDCIHWRGQNDICEGIAIDFGEDGYCSEGKHKDGGQEDDEPCLMTAAPEIVEVTHGRWIEIDGDELRRLCECDSCHDWVMFDGSYVAKYCPNCGAKMDGGRGDV